MLEEIEMLCQSNKIRKHSIRSLESAGLDDAEEENKDNNGDEIDEEKVCNICCYLEKDTTFVPCGHQTCYKCI